MPRARVEGLDKLIKDIKKLENMPQKQITKGVRRGANVILREARAIAKTRHKTNKMWKKLTLKPERSKRRGKKVMQVTYQKVEKFPEAVKITKDGTRYYYPASQNFGFKTRLGTGKKRKKNGKEKVEGLNFLSGAMERKYNEASKVIIEEIGKEIDKSLADGGLTRR